MTVRSLWAFGALAVAAGLTAGARGSVKGAHRSPARPWQTVIREIDMVARGRGARPAVASLTIETRHRRVIPRVRLSL